jgi:hypothetical protein
VCSGGALKSFIRRHKILFLAGVLALVGLGVVRAATSRPSLELMLAEVQERLEERLGLSLDVGTMHVAPGAARFEVAPVVVKDLDGEVLFSADRMAVELAPLSFLSRRVEVDDVQLDGVRVHARVTKDGRVLGVKPISLEGGERSDEPLFRVDIGDFRVNDAEIVVDIEDVGTARVRGIKSRLRSSGRDGHRVKFSVKSASFERPGDIIATEDFSGRLVVFGDGLLAPERVTLNDIFLRAPEGSMHLSGSLLLGPLDVVPALDLDVTGTTSLPLLMAHLKDMPVAMNGEIAVGAHVQSGLGGQDLQVVGQGDINDLRVDGFVVGTGRGRFVADKKRVTFSEATWESGGTPMDVTATVQLNDRLDFTYEASGADYSIYTLLDGLKIDGSWAEVLVDGEIVGDGQVLPEFVARGHGSGVFHDLAVANRDVKTVDDEGDIIIVCPREIRAEADFVADFAHLEIHGVVDDGVTRATGDVSLFWDPGRGFEVFAASDQAGFGTFDNSIANIPFEGSGGFQLQIAGPYENPLIVAQGQMDNLAIDGYELADTGTGHIRYLAGELGFFGLKARKGESRFAGDVVIDWWEPTARYVMTGEDGARLDPPARIALSNGMNMDIDMDVLEGEVRDLRDMIPTRFEDGALAFFRDLELDGPIKGNIDIEGYVGDGTIDHLMGEADLALGAGALLLGQKLDGGHAHVQFAPGQYRIPTLMVAAADGTLTGDVTLYRDDGELSGPVKVRGLRLAGIDSIRSEGEDARTWAGTADADLALSGLAENPTLIGTARLNGAAWGDVPIGGADMQVLHKDRVIALQGPVMSGRGQGVITVATTEPFDYEAHVEIGDGPLRPLLPPDTLPAWLQLKLGGVVDAAGALSTFSSSRGTAVLTSLDGATDDGLSITSKGDVIAHFFGDDITIDQMELITPRDDTFDIGGRLSASDVDLTASGRGDLWVVATLAEPIRASSGRTVFDVALSGDWDNPRVSGRASVASGRFDLQDVDPVIDDLETRLVFTGETVLIESARGTVGGAPFSGEGTVSLKDFAPSAYDIEVTYKKLDLAIPEWLPTRSSGTVTLSGPAEFPTLGGEVELLQATYSEDINWERFLPEFRRKVRAPQVFDKTAEDLRLDVHIVSDGGIVVENNVADMEAKADLRLVGTEERPGMKGTLSLLHGLVDFRNNRYRLTRGNVEFTETYAITPLLDVEAETTVKDYDITAQVTGPVKNLRIDLSSRPDLAEIDILALLTFGFTQVELQDTTTTAGVAGLEVVSAYTGLEQEVKRILPDAVRDSGVLKVDELRLTSQFSRRQQGTVPAVSVGFEVNPGFWGVDGSKLRLSSTLVDSGGTGTDQRIEWEKRFDNNLRLRLSWRSQDQGACPQCSNQWGDVGGDIWYRWEFQPGGSDSD